VRDSKPPGKYLYKSRLVQFTRQGTLVIVKGLVTLFKLSLYIYE